MNSISRLCLIAVSLAAPQVHAQQLRTATWNTDRFLLRYRTMLEPVRLQSELSIGGGGADDATTNHRVLIDGRQKKYLGYDLSVDPKGGGRFSVNIRPLTMTPEHLQFFRLDNSYSPMPLPAYPGVISVGDGETIAFDLLVNPSTGQKIVEYVTVSEPSKPASARAAARDLQLNDVQMTLSSPRLYINGKRWEWNQGDAHGQAEGPVLWVYVPGRGRFLFSFTARSGYRKAGDVRGRKMKFEWNGETYELDNGDRVLSGDGAWSLYVDQDLAWSPGRYPPTLYGAATP